MKRPMCSRSFILIVSALALVSVALLGILPTYCPADPATTGPIKPPLRTAADALTPKLKDAKRHNEFMYRKSQGDIGLLFMGDSITDFWPRTGEFSWLKFAPYQPADFGVSGDRTEHVLWRITNGELDGIHPTVMVLLIGTNNIGNKPVDTPEWTAAAVAKIIEIARQKLPQTKILLLAVFPRDNANSESRHAVEKINEGIAKLADDKRVRYLDIGKVFLDANAEIPPDVMPDKLHPSAKGYDLWYDAIAPTVAEMMKQ